MNKDILLKNKIDVPQALERFAHNEAMYQKYLLRFEEDKSFKNLETAIKDKEYYLAFQAAHTLKGIAGNLSLTPLYEKMCDLVTYLRDSSDIQKAELIFPQVCELYEQTVQTIRESAKE
ncbi:MAG: Hpt domain-containing protein [Synergistaceae bacterium]